MAIGWITRDYVLHVGLTFLAYRSDFSATSYMHPGFATRCNVHRHYPNESCQKIYESSDNFFIGIFSLSNYGYKVKHFIKVIPNLKVIYIVCRVHVGFKTYFDKFMVSI